MRRVTHFSLATILVAVVVGGVASAAENVVTKVTARADGGKTIIVVHGSATPSFTAYRLERPSRVMVDVADGKIGSDELRAGPIDVDTWAVGQIATAQYQSDVSRTARVMIGFKRPSSYDVKAVGHDLVITVTPDEPMPAGGAGMATAEQIRADQAKMDEARKRRVEAEAQTQATEQRRQVAENAERSAVARANDAVHEADAARTRAQAAKDELDRVIAARKAEEARLKDVQSRASTVTAQSAQAAAQNAAAQAQAQRDLAAQRDQQRAEVAAEQARLDKLRGEAQAMAAQREAEAKKLAETQAAVRKAAEERQAKLADAAEAARSRQTASEAARVAEERRASARAEEAARLAQAAASAERARATDDRARASESASREADNRAQAAAARAQAAEEAARVEQQKVATLRAASEKQAAAQAAAQADLDKARAELAKLATAQESERARVEEARREATALAAERAQASERAQHAAALASGSLEKMQQAEREARKAAEARAQESARLDSVKKEMQAVADARMKELTKLDAARAEAKKLETARRAEEAHLAQLRDDVRRQSDELQARNDQLAKTSGELDRKSNALAATSSELDRKANELAAKSNELQARNDQLAKTSGELERKSGELQSKNDELARKIEAARATSADAARAHADLARLQAELRKLDADRKAAAQAQKAEESQAAQQSAEERARMEHERGELQAQMSGERAALQKKLAAAQAEMTRVTGEQQKKQAALATAKSDLQAAQAEMARLVAEQDKKRAEGAALDSRLVAARAELARIEAETRRRLAMVPTPAKMAAAAKVVAAPAVKPMNKDALPTEKLAAASKVRDVRFADDGDAERVIVDVGDKGDAQASVIRADENKAVLKIAGASLPKKLERTLDASAFAGPIRSVSTYADPDDAGAVRVEVALTGDGPHAQPKLVRDAGTLTWEFPRSGTQNVAPTKVAGYSSPLPLQVAPAAGVGRAGRQRKVYTGKRMDLDFVNADLQNLFKFISDVGQVNIVLADDVKGTVTMHLRDVPWDQALDVIARAKGLGVQRQGNLIRIAPQSVLEKELEAEVARAKASVELEPMHTKLIPLSYADGTQMLPRIHEVMSPRGHVSVDTRTNQLILTDVSANIALAEDLVGHLDTQTPQVLIESRIVEATTNFTRDIGIQWGGNSINSAATGNPTGIAFPSTVGVAGGATDAQTVTQGLQLAQSGAASPNYVVNMPAAVGTGSGGALGVTLGSLNGAVNINLRLSSLENTGNVRIVSAPKVMTLDNIEASISQGTSIPISVVSAAGANTVFVDAQLNLTVKPHVTNEGSVLMNVHITRNEPDFVNVGARGDPTILKREARTQMLVRDGDTAVIGGIYTRNTGLSYTKVPWFADIPVIGWLFKNRRENDDRTELLIFITPRIVNRSVVAR